MDEGEETYFPLYLTLINNFAGIPAELHVFLGAMSFTGHYHMFHQDYGGLMNENFSSLCNTCFYDEILTFESTFYFNTFPFYVTGKSSANIEERSGTLC